MKVERNLEITMTFGGERHRVEIYETNSGDNVSWSADATDADDMQWLLDKITGEIAGWFEIMQDDYDFARKQEG